MIVRTPPTFARSSALNGTFGGNFNLTQRSQHDFLVGLRSPLRFTLQQLKEVDCSTKPIGCSSALRLPVRSLCNDGKHTTTHICFPDDAIPSCPNARARLNHPVQLLHAGRTVDANDLAVDPLAILRREEAHDAGNVDGQTDAVERRPGGSILRAR